MKKESRRDDDWHALRAYVITLDDKINMNVHRCAPCEVSRLALVDTLRSLPPFATELSCLRIMVQSKPFLMSRLGVVHGRADTQGTLPAARQACLAMTKQMGAMP